MLIFGMFQRVQIEIPGNEQEGACVSWPELAGEHKLLFFIFCVWKKPNAASIYMSNTRPRGRKKKKVKHF